MSYHDIFLEYETTESHLDENPVPNKLYSQKHVSMTLFTIETKYPPKQFKLTYYNREYITGDLFCDKECHFLYTEECKAQSNECWCQVKNNLIWGENGVTTFSFANLSYIMEVDISRNDEKKCLNLKIKLKTKPYGY